MKNDSRHPRLLPVLSEAGRVRGSSSRLRRAGGWLGLLMVAAGSLLSVIGSGTATADSANWGAQAEQVCANAYWTRGFAPRAWDPNDDMALYKNWYADLLGRTANALSSIGGSTTDGDALVNAMAYLSQLDQRAALIYNTHPVFSQELNAIEAQTTQVAQSIAAQANTLGAPTCGALANL